MKITLTLLISLFIATTLYAQSELDRKGVERACLDYLEGFYEGDTVKIKNSIKPTLYKFGYWKKKGATNYESDGQMTYAEAVAFARNVLEKKHFAKADAPKKVEVLDIGNYIASAKVTAWWGIDYILLSRNEDRWMIEQVLWEGPLVK